MIYWILEQFGLEGTRLITLRSALAAITSFVLCVGLGPHVIRFLLRKKIGEHVHTKDSAQLTEIHKTKANTPTMGGIFISFSIIISACVWGAFDSIYLIMAIVSMVLFGGLGVVDDSIKLFWPKKQGLSVRQKLVIQFLFAMGISSVIAYALRFEELGWHLQIPALTWINIGPGIVILFGIVIVSASNAVNLTDGLDGLAAGCLVMSGLAYAVISYIVGRADYSEFLNLPHINYSGELTVFCAALTGACLGFLWFNCHPAQVFMGDSGSLPLGASLGVVAISVKHELLLFLVGGIFVIEALSVVLQVMSYKIWKKRIFRIAPLHHHFEFLDWPEPRIVVRFWIVAAVLALMSLATLKAG
jgi:phospho-N-acetylmuramoyl-pentapeptide-transferase